MIKSALCFPYGAYTPDTDSSSGGKHKALFIWRLNMSTEMTNYGDKRMTVKEVAEALGVDISTITKRAKELFPELIKNGITTYFTEAQVVEIKAALTHNGHLGQLSEVQAATTDLEMRQKAAEVMAWLMRDVEMLKAKNAELAPKAAFFDQVADSKTALQMRDVAAALNIPGWGRNKIFELLRAKGILDDRNVPYRRYQDAMYFRVIEQKFTDEGGETHISLKTLVYQRGVDFIRKTIEAEK